jgi:hypothetical protein
MTVPSQGRSGALTPGAPELYARILNPITDRRVNVYLSTALRDRINALRRRGVDLAISNICQRALEKACTRLERSLQERE